MADDRGYVEPRCLPRAGPGDIPWRGSNSSSDTRETGYSGSQAKSPHICCRVPLGGTARKKDSATSSTVSPQGKIPPQLATSRARTCHLRHLRPSLGTFTAQASKSTCLHLPPGELGGAFHQLLEESLSFSEAARHCCSVTAPPAAAVPHCHIQAPPCLELTPRTTRAPCGGRGRAPAPSHGEQQGRGLPPSALPPSSGDTASLRGGDRSLGQGERQERREEQSGA